MKNIKNLTSRFGGRFATVQIATSKSRPRTVCARFLGETPKTVNLQLVNEGNRIQRFYKTSIKGASSGTVAV